MNTLCLPIVIKVVNGFIALKILNSDIRVRDAFLICGRSYLGELYKNLVSEKDMKDSRR